MSIDYNTIRNGSLTEFSDASLIGYFAFLHFVPSVQLDPVEFQACVEQFVLRKIDATGIDVRDVNSKTKNLSEEQDAYLVYKQRYFQQAFPEEWASLQEELQTKALQDAEKLRKRQEVEDRKRLREEAKLAKLKQDEAQLSMFPDEEIQTYKTTPPKTTRASL